MNSPAIAPGAVVPSPCTSVCTMDAVTGLCAGCYRTLDEIAVWSVLDNDEKCAVWQALAQRRAAHPPAIDSAMIGADEPR